MDSRAVDRFAGQVIVSGNGGLWPEPGHDGRSRPDQMQKIVELDGYAFTICINAHYGAVGVEFTGDLDERHQLDGDQPRSEVALSLVGAAMRFIRDLTLNDVAAVAVDTQDNVSAQRRLVSTGLAGHGFFAEPRMAIVFEARTHSQIVKVASPMIFSIRWSVRRWRNAASYLCKPSHTLIVSSRPRYQFTACMKCIVARTVHLDEVGAGAIWPSDVRLELIPMMGHYGHVIPTPTDLIK